MTLIKMDGHRIIKEANKAPRCWNCTTLDKTQLPPGLRRPYNRRGVPEYEGLCQRKSDGKVFSVWRCTECKALNFVLVPPHKVDLDNPNAPILDESQFPGIVDAN